MQNEQQYEQLMLLYNQLKNGAEDIYRMIEKEDYDGAITVIKSRESLFLNCKCMRKFLELTPEQEETANKLFNEIKILEEKNIQTLTDGINHVKAELKRTQKAEKIHNAYDFDETQKGSIINVEE